MLIYLNTMRIFYSTQYEYNRIFCGEIIIWLEDLHCAKYILLNIEYHKIVYKSWGKTNFEKIFE